MAVDTIYLKNEQGVDVPYQLGADSRNVTYSPNAETVEGSVHKELQQNNIHKNTIIANSTGVHGLRYTDNKLQVQAPGGGWTPIDFGTGDMKKVNYDDPDQDGVIAIAHGGTGNTSGYVRAGAESGSTIGSKATAEGRDTVASKEASHAEGIESEALGFASHAEGNNTTAYGEGHHAEGFQTGTSGDGYGTHSEGYYTGAEGTGCHVGGIGVQAYGNGTFLHGVGVVRGQSYQNTYGGYPNQQEKAANFVIVDGQRHKFNGENSCDSDTAFALTPTQSIIRDGSIILANGCYIEIPDKEFFAIVLTPMAASTYLFTVSLFEKGSDMVRQPAHSLNYIIVGGYNSSSPSCIVPLNTDSDITDVDFLIATTGTSNHEIKISGASASNYRKIVQAIRLN